VLLKALVALSHGLWENLLEFLGQLFEVGGRHLFLAQWADVLLIHPLLDALSMECVHRRAGHWRDHFSLHELPQANGALMVFREHQWIISLGNDVLFQLLGSPRVLSSLSE